MKLVHKASGAVLASQISRAVTLKARLIGLLGRNAFPEGEALVLEPCSSIHTFFMQFPIDAAFLSNDGRVLKLYESLQPWRATRIHPSAALVVELPAGTLARTGTREGDRLVFVAGPARGPSDGRAI
jgi:uncharacterized membrane protein (UPF0127 family)